MAGSSERNVTLRRAVVPTARVGSLSKPEALTEANRSA